MDIRSSLFDDLETFCKNSLKNNGYAYSEESPYPIAYQYLNVLRRRVDIRPRQVKIHPSLVCPDSCQQGFMALTSAFELGIDVNRSLSSNIIQADYQDGFLNDYGLHHFHLGLGLETRGKSKGFVERTGPVLLVYVTENIAYLVDIKVHGKDGDPYIWTDQDVIERLHCEWPDAIKRFQLNGILSSGLIPTSQQKKKLRKAATNTSIEMPDGTVYMSPGGGVTCASTSTRLQIDYDRFWMEAKDALRSLIDYISKELVLCQTPITLKFVSIFDGYFFHDSTNRITYRIKYDYEKERKSITVFRWGGFPEFYPTHFEFSKLAKSIS